MIKTSILDLTALTPGSGHFRQDTLGCLVNSNSSLRIIIDKWLTMSNLSSRTFAVGETAN